MAGDALTQTHTEARTSQFIRESGEIMALLARDGIDLSEVDDDRIYPIADNERPRLSADRLENSIAMVLVGHGAWRLEDIEGMYGALAVGNGEDGRTELVFQDVRMAERFVQGVCLYGRVFQTNNNKLTLMYIAEILRACVREGVLTVDELYVLDEQQVIARIAEANQEIRNMWRVLERFERVQGSPVPVSGCYCARVDAKLRYIDPLVTLPGGARRASAISGDACRRIADLLAFSDLPYGWIAEAPPIREGT